jgi:hypothetical protein
MVNEEIVQLEIAERCEFRSRLSRDVSGKQAFLSRFDDQLMLRFVHPRFKFL